MNSMRSSFAILFATLGALAAVTNCTVKSVEDDGKGGSSSNTTNNTDDKCTPGDSKDCTCTNGKKGAQECNAKGSGYAACVCDGVVDTGGTGGTGNDNYAGEDTGGTTTGGTTTMGGDGSISEGGVGGVDPFANIDPEDCGACLAELCPTEWAACNADEQCLSAELDGSGQYERIQNGCIEPARLDGPVKRDAARGCGVSIGQDTDPQFLVDWAPENMAASTTNLMNCMAMGAKAPDASWANDPDNFPVVNDEVQPTPWPAGTCAKLACTSSLKQ